MNTLKKAFIFCVPLILAAWVPAGWAGVANICEPYPACVDGGGPVVSVPEPSVLLLLAGGLGAGALARYLRKRK